MAAFIANTAILMYSTSFNGVYDFASKSLEPFGPVFNTLRGVNNVLFYTRHAPSELSQGEVFVEKIGENLFSQSATTPEERLEDSWVLVRLPEEVNIILD